MEETLRKILAAAAEQGLPFLLIGGHAVILFGFSRNTLDLDLLVPESSRFQWLNLMRRLDFKFFHGVSAFAQFEPGNEGGAGVDLMFVDDRTWGILSAAGVPKQIAGHEVQVPSPENLVALKLHAASSPTRSKPESDWEDVRQIIRLCELDLDSPTFQELIVRYGGRKALDRLLSGGK